VVLVAVAQPSRGFIPEAAASSLSRVSSEGSNAASASPSDTLLRATDEPEATLWTQTWPYVAILLSIGAIALTAFAKRRGVAVPSWGAPTLSNSKSPMQNSGAASTFGNFDVMTEAGPIVLRAGATSPPDDPTYDASLDTLLQVPEGQSDGIDEHVIRKTWATLANESAVDIGTDSILKAIEAAERDLHISPPEPAQAAIDQALDDDLMREPRPKPRR